MAFRRMAVSIAAAALALGTARAESPLQGEWVDLTHTLDETSVFWPTAKAFHHDAESFGQTEGGYFYSAYNIRTSEHGGTHLDAPIHFAEGAQTADEVPLDRLIGPAAVIDVTEASGSDRDYRFTAQDVLDWEARHGEIAPGAIVLFRTGFSKFWPDREAYMGTAERGAEAVAQLHFPGLSEAAARLLKERDVAAVGLDTPSLDYGQSKDFIAHRVLLGAQIPGFENVTNLDRLPEWGASVIALPAKIGKGSGAPLRIVALLPKEE
ncbi:cyclase [Novosphingobium indicum]|uniref:Cyclase n=2 Tax=Novosphingobium indicum TaxID=462949 RepID=A0ABQ2J889_9SPHN|nr:cyclase [Novosphingobium indicum]